MFRARLGVRARILAIALIPSLTLLVIGVGAAGYLVNRGNHAKEWAAAMQQVIAPTAEMMQAIQLERQLTLTRLAGDESVTPSLTAARVRLDNALREVNTASAPLIELDPDKIDGKFEDSSSLTTHLTAARAGVDAGALPVLDAYGFYNRLLDIVAIGGQIAQQTAPDSETAVELAESIRMLYAAESMSRSNAVALANVAGDGNLLIPMEEFLREVGFYHTEISYLSGELDTHQREAAKALTSSAAWHQLTTMENAIAQRNTTPPASSTNSSIGTGGSSRAAAPAPLPMEIPEWQNAAAQVNSGLINMWVVQNEHAHGLSEEVGRRNAANSLWAGGIVLVVSIAAFFVALVLANRIIRRLKRLRGETLALADERLPDMMRRLRAGEAIDPAAESPQLDYGHDEIGQVAKAFQHAHTAAVEGAVGEARTREGVKAVFLNIAHRSQIVVHRQLEILDEAENRQEDPALLETLFRLDHLATRERRNAENLIILGGGQPGRQWRNPVPLIDLVRSAVGETLDYARVRVARLPETHVVGSVVADIVHLLAELVDNATSFSPPQSKVELFGNVVGKGVVVEISDQGMGMPQGELDRMNEMLRNPPDFGVAALSVDSRLGLFVVAQLGIRHGVTVRLADSDYGGIRAIVLLPTSLLAAETVTRPSEPELPDAARRHRHPVPFIESAQASAGESESAVLTAPPVTPPTAAPSVTTTGPQPTGPDGRPLLPRRNRQANLAPELAKPAVVEPVSERERSAEQARDLMSAIENGTRQGRRAQPTDEQEQEGDGDRSQNR
ncbi:nitrate- and nitrite sensing domain-containing protein [Nocardia sp. NPDC050710]|uniref:sensor histidine kinase n=1 Tax=Nocardia sp. NPDC050710 TaxID=3157220 RepID=UPI0033FB1BFC